VPEPTLPDKVVGAHRALDAARVPHAFGGAVALAYYAAPRATVDIDVNLFVAPERLSEVLDMLAPLGVDAAGAGTAASVVKEGQCRVWWGSTPLDLFFAYHPLHRAMSRDARLVPFGEETIPILSPEHLVACKAMFDRRKDWLDIEEILVAVPDLRVDEALSWVCDLAGEQDPRARRLRELVDQLLRPGDR
jgi:hypothetical protein